MDWSDPVARLHLIDEVGPARYNELHRQHMVDSTVATVNGYPIRPVMSQRYGRIFMVDGANIGFRTQAEAEQRAMSLPAASS